MSAGENAAAMALFAAHSTSRDATARVVAERWRHLADDHESCPRILDLGTGDGGLLGTVLTQLGISCAITVVEPDERLVPAALHRLRELGHDVDRSDDVNSGEPIDAYLAAQVLFYLPDLSDWFTGAVARLAPAGVLSCVLRSPACDCYQLRQMVREHYGIAPRICAQQLHNWAGAHGMTTDTANITSAFSYPVDDPRLAARPADSTDPHLARLICWLAGLPSDQTLPAQLRHGINEFLHERRQAGVLILNQADLLVTASRCDVASPGQPPTRPPARGQRP